MEPKSNQREKEVTGQSKPMKRRGEGLGTGPVGRADGYAGRNGSSGGSGRRDGQGGGGLLGGKTSIIAIIIALVLGGGGGLTALLAGGGVAIGMALSGTLQNFSGGLLILAFKPFKVGDFIEAQGYAGTVTEMSIVSTRLTLPQRHDSPRTVGQRQHQQLHAQSFPPS